MFIKIFVVLIGLIIMLLLILLEEINKLEINLELTKINKEYYRKTKIELEHRLKELENKFEYDLQHKTNVEYKKVNLDLVRGEYSGEKYWEQKDT